MATTEFLRDLYSDSENVFFTFKIAKIATFSSITSTPNQRSRQLTLDFSATHDTYTLSLSTYPLAYVKASVDL